MTTAPDLNVTFYDHLQPKATAGVYTVTMNHRLTLNGSPVDTEGAQLPRVADRYEVRVAQFTLDPTFVHASYPPADAAGLYTYVLPHITLNRAILPWERELQGRATRAPWLALLVFAEGEVLDDPTAEGAFTQRTVGELRSPGPGLHGPELSGELDESVQCRTIDVPAAVFTAIVPREDELFHLAHVRDVKTAPQRRDDGEILRDGEYAVLAANRFPRAEGRYAVHLVSLEGWIGRLAPGTLPADDAVRLCTLWSWSFTNDPDGSLNPGKLLADLVAPGADHREHLALRLRPDATGRAASPEDRAASPEEEHARERLHHGYTAVPYRTLSGEHTYAWYRGPFTPLTAPDVPRAEDDGPYTTADHALIYDPEHGLFDVSYAAAWTLGRTIALADPDYSAEVVETRRELANRAATLSALSADRDRALHDPDALPAATALRELADAGFGRGLVGALKAPLAPEARRSRLAPPARREAPALLADPRTRRSLSAVAEARTPTASAWMERLGLLRGVPFNHLVPDPRMLPPESLRLFRLDPGWIRALVAGASDIGAHTSVDRDLDEVLRARLTRSLGATEPVAGLLMNSELVRAWPVFDILASRGPGQVPVKELRRDHLAPDVLLVLWDGLPDRIAIREPGQGIHFGVSAAKRINLRHLTGDKLGEHTGEQFPATNGPDLFDAHLRPARGSAERDVLDLRGLLPALRTALRLTADPTPAQFALELVNAPLEQLLLPANNA